MALYFSLIYNSLWIIVIYAFLGWCVEVAFHAVNMGKFVNRGFLSGPYCPIYGFGFLAVLLCLAPVEDSVLYLFIGSVIITSTLEFFTGFVLEKVFHDKWWDYSAEPLNIKGYICLRFSLTWGLACLLVIDIVHPLIMDLINWMPPLIGMVILTLLIVTMLVDAVLTFIETFRLTKKLDNIENAEIHIRKLSEGIGSAVAEGAINAKGKIESGKEKAKLKKLQAREDFSAIQKRLLKSYPRFANGRYKNSISKLKLLVSIEQNRPNKSLTPLDKPQTVLKNLPLIHYRDTFSTVIDLLEANDPYTSGHSRRVALLAYRFCRALNLPLVETEIIYTAASLHDIGKIGVPDSILNKKAPLSITEWKAVKQHPEVGTDLIKKACNLDDIANIIRHHHEKANGRGYPDGLTLEQIPHGSLIIAICDSTDAMMTKRAYRQATGVDFCRRELQNKKGTMYAPYLVDAFLKNWDYIVGDLYDK